MSINEIKERLEQVERAIWFEEMADFMNWSNYYKLRAEQDALQKALAVA